MKINLSIDCDAADAVTIQVLRAYLLMLRGAPFVIEDEEYQAHLFRCTNFVIEHFGGEPVSPKKQRGH